MVSEAVELTPPLAAFSQSGEVTHVAALALRKDRRAASVSVRETANVRSLTGKMIDISGVIQMYEGKPEIIVTSRVQIKTK